MRQFPQDSVTTGHPTTSQIEDHEAVESDRRTASTLLRLLAISIPIAAVVIYFGTAGRRTGSQQSAVGSPQSAGDSPQAAPAALPAAEAPAPAPEPVAAVPAADRFIVQVTAARQSWISAIVDGSRATQREFKPGEEASFEVRREIVL